MAKEPLPDHTVPAIGYEAWTDGFEGIDYVAYMSGPFEVTNPIQAAQLRAQNLGLVVVVKVACVKPTYFYPEEGSQNAQPEE